MEPKKLLTADYLDIIYDKRNKAYGGYELRRNYDRRVRKALVFALTGVSVFISFSFVNASHNGKAANAKRDSAYVMTNVLIQPPPPPVIVPPPPVPAQKIKSDVFTVPKIEQNDEVKPDETMTENKKITGVSGPTTQGGDSLSIGPSGDGKKPGKETGIFGGDDKAKEPPRYVEQMPRYPGDVTEYLSKNLHYPEAARESGIEGRVSVEFIVSEDGSVTNARIVRGIGGGCDQEALRVVSSMPKWKPGKQNGIPVKVYFGLTISFKLN